MSYTERFQEMGKGMDLAQAMAEADRCLLCHDPPCSKGCPAETDPGTFIRKLRLRNVTGAIRTIKKNNSLGGACGVLCPAPRLCQKECSATGIGRPVEIGRVQRALIEHSWQIGFSPIEKPPQTGRQVAVVGSGPAGLACAAELARNGHSVTVFEERAEPGGILRYGVPAHRFDRAFLKNEIAELEALGVKFVCNARVEGGRGVQKLLRDGFGAVFLAPGLWGAERTTGAEKVSGIHTAVEFLARIREERCEEIVREIEGRAVAVIGGGSVAMDCAQSAVTLGARDVFLVYRRSFAQMPAEEDERLATLRRGVHFLLLNQPTGYAADAAECLKGVKLVRTRLTDPDATGRRRPEEIRGSQWTLEAQVAVEALGNRPDTADWAGVVAVGRDRRITSDPRTGKTSARAIFAGGDIVRGPSLVVEAVQDGKLAARSILNSLG